MPSFDVTGLTDAQRPTGVWAASLLGSPGVADLKDALTGRQTGARPRARARRSGRLPDLDAGAYEVRFPRFAPQLARDAITDQVRLEAQVLGFPGPSDAVLSAKQHSPNDLLPVGDHVHYTAFRAILLSLHTRFDGACREAGQW